MIGDVARKHDKWLFKFVEAFVILGNMITFGLMARVHFRVTRTQFMLMSTEAH